MTMEENSTTGNKKQSHAKGKKSGFRGALPGHRAEEMATALFA